MADLTEVSESQAVTGLLAALPVTAQATTSRVVVNNQRLRVVVFAFDSGELLTEHTSPRAVICQLLDGRMRFTVGDAEHLLVPGDVVYLAPGERHALTAEAPSHLSLVMVDTAS